MSSLQPEADPTLFSAHELTTDARPMGTATERRRAIRYQLRAPVVFRSAEDERATHGAGFVEDISTEGVFVLCPSMQCVGNLVELEILLPPLGQYSTKLVVKYTGIIVRVVEDGFAVAAKVSLHRYIMREHSAVSDGELE